MKKRAEFFALYGGLLKGLNLVQQKGWSESELMHYFPHEEPIWAPLLKARHPRQLVSTEKKVAHQKLVELLADWDDPVEAALLKRRLEKIRSYYQEIDKEYCDAESLKFFLQDLPLIDVNAPTTMHATPVQKTLTSLEAQKLLDLELSKLFPDFDVKTMLSEKTLARASTTKKGIRLREDVSFTKDELKMLTVHEAWVHLGSNLAGSLQTDLPWLSSWHPGVTGFQEGLALIAEMVSGDWFKIRGPMVILRHKAALLGLQGEDARGVWQYLKDHHIPSEHALEITLRIFRGCPLSGGMVFGKEFQYLLGLHQWLIRMETLTPEDMCLALSGKMDFLEWEMLKNSALKEKLRLATPPERLQNWMKLLKRDELKARLEFKKIA